jgi:zinc dependent phospholipase C
MSFASMNLLKMHAIPGSALRRCFPTLVSSLLLMLFFLGSATQVCEAYSVLTHEEIVDLLWKDQITPLLLKKYPDATEEQLREAHAYAYGGSVIQDMGYYPFGNRQFSDLVHYVRSGDFVEALIDEATDINEYAFALGALAHYASDLTGHPAVNSAVALGFPKLKAKYGNQVTFAQDQKAHIRTEFGFDVVQVARQRYTPDTYHDFIGFQVAKPVLERAFLATYGIELKDMFFSLDLSIGTFRRAISQIIPQMTRVALVIKKADLIKENPTFQKKKFLYNLSRTDYERNWGESYQKPGAGAKILAVLFRLIPKVGPFKAIGFQTPTRQTEALYVKSVNDTVDQYRIYLLQLSTREVSLQNRDFDTGKPTQAAEYQPTDHAYAKLLDKLAGEKFVNMTPKLRQDILHFFQGRPAAVSARSAPASTKKEREEWQNALKNVEQLKSMPEVEAAVTGIDITC